MVAIIIFGGIVSLDNQIDIPGYNSVKIRGRVKTSSVKWYKYTNIYLSIFKHSITILVIVYFLRASSSTLPGALFNLEGSALLYLTLYPRYYDVTTMTSLL